MDSSQNKVDQILQFSSIDELIYHRISTFIEVDHESRHKISAQNLNLLLSLHRSSLTLHSHLHPTHSLPSLPCTLKTITRLQSAHCSLTRCSKLTTKKKDKKYTLFFTSVWKEVVKGRLDEEGVEGVLEEFQEENGLSNFEMGKVRGMVVEALGEVLRV
ncbi:unnamed protein product [Moneuplotes crassus]|uniref:Uncharacterized protein n=1 Tax=Euplotes crassus TaxID=5936 RepID=A0AAD1Y1P8_EUPCR|nr:unnamed protein product [Moneuplotes crassus]